MTTKCDQNFKVNMTSTATIVANSLGNFIIEANCPFSLLYWMIHYILFHFLLDAPLHFLIQLLTNIVCPLHEIKCFSLG